MLLYTNKRVNLGAFHAIAALEKSKMFWGGEGGERRGCVHRVLPYPTPVRLLKREELDGRKGRDEGVKPTAVPRCVDGWPLEIIQYDQRGVYFVDDF